MTSQPEAARRPLASSTPFPQSHRTPKRIVQGILEVSNSSSKGPDKLRPATIGVKITGPLRHQYESLLRQVQGIVSAAGLKAQFTAKDTNLVTLMAFDMSLDDRNMLYENLVIGEIVTLTLHNLVTTPDNKIVCKVSLPPDDQILPMLATMVTEKGSDPMIMDGMELGSYDGPIRPAQHRIMEKCLYSVSVTVRIPMQALTWQRPDGSEVATFCKQMTRGTFMSEVKSAEWSVYRKETRPAELRHFLDIYSDEDEQQGELRRENLQEVLQHDFHADQTVPEISAGAYRLMGLQAIEVPLRQISALTSAAMPKCLEMHKLSQKLLSLWTRCNPRTLVETAKQSGMSLRDFVTLIHISRAADHGYDRAQQHLQVVESARALTQVSLDESIFSSAGNQTVDSTTERTLAQAAEEMITELRHEKGYTQKQVEFEEEEDDFEEDGWGKGLDFGHTRTALFTTANTTTKEDSFLPDPVPIPEGILPQLDPSWFHIRYGSGPQAFPPAWLASGNRMRKAGQYTRYLDAIAAVNHLPDYQLRSVICFLWSAVEQMQHMLDDDKVKQWKTQKTEVSEEDKDWTPPASEPTVPPPGLSGQVTSASSTSTTPSVSSTPAGLPHLSEARPGKGRVSSPADIERRQSGQKPGQLNNQAADRQAQREIALGNKNPTSKVTFQKPQHDSSDIYSDHQ